MPIDFLPRAPDTIGALRGTDAVMANKQRDSRPNLVNDLRHLAFVIDGLAMADRVSAAAASFENACRIVEFSFSTFPDLAAVSFFSPEIQRWLQDFRDDRAFLQICSRGLRNLESVAKAADGVFRVLGRTDDLPDAIQIPNSPPGARRRQVSWFLNYSGRDEILRAAERYLRSNLGVPLQESEFPAWLDTAGLPDPDLLLYAGGELKPKDFLLWQASYAEIWYSPEPWPTFSTGTLLKATKDYFARHRRFGR